jgi:nucleoside-diphosphate-sugar epimerase
LKVLVTGATGFIGGHLAQSLIEAGHEVSGLARANSDTSRLKELDMKIIHGDIRDAGAMEKAARDCDCIYHLAAKTTKDRLSKKQYYSHNIEGTRNVARAALAAGVGRLVYASTNGVYGTVRNLSIDENTEPNPDSYYRETKLEAEKEIVRLHRESGLPAVVARFGSVFGPESCSWLDVCRKIGRGNFRIIGTGENYDHLVYVDDLVEGVRRCGEAKGIEGKTYIITGPKPAKLKQVLQMIAEELEIDSVPHKLPAAPFRVYQQLCKFVYRCFGIQVPRAHYYDLFLMNCIYTTSKARDELAYSPNVSLKDGLRRLLTWYRQKGYLLAVEDAGNRRVETGER